MTPLALAFDIGGTKIRAALIDEHGTLHQATTVATNAAEGREAVLRAMLAAGDMLTQWASHTPHHMVTLGISSCGVIDPHSATVVAAAPSIPNWEGANLGAIFHDHFHLPVFADNDANCALVGEYWNAPDAAPTGGLTLMLTLGTGLGGAVMIDGRLITGLHHRTGHFGIAEIYDPIAQKMVPTEWLVSGTGLFNSYQRLAGAARDVLHGEAVMARVERGDPLALAALDLWLTHLTSQLNNLYWMLDPARIIIGGGVIDSRALWWPGLIKHLHARGVSVPLQAAQLGNDAGVFGAAKLAWDRLEAQ